MHRHHTLLKSKHPDSLQLFHPPSLFQRTSSFWVLLEILTPKPIHAPPLSIWNLRVQQNEWLAVDRKINLIYEELLQKSSNDYKTK